MSEKYEHNERLAKWLSGELDSDELSRLEGDNSLDELKAVLQDIDSWSLPVVDVEKRLGELKSKVEKKETKEVAFRPAILLRYAAVIALILTSYFAGRQLLFNPNVIIETGIGEQMSHELPDGSVVTLGPVSRLEYKKKDWIENRSSTLVGQGFFDVESGPGFSVTTDQGTISVLGTEFDILIDGQRLAVNCYEGRVMVDMVAQDEILNAQQGLTLDDGRVDRSEFSSENPNWLGEKSSFEEALLSAVVFELKRYYQLEIDLPQEHKSKEFTGSFVHNDLEEALKSIFTPLEIKYTLSDNGKVVFD